MKQLLLLLFAFCIGGHASAFSGNDSTEIRKVIDQLFDGMRENDSAKVRACFKPEPTMVSFTDERGKMNPTGGLKQHQSELDRFLAQIANGQEAMFDERIFDVVIHVDGPMAVAWVPYTFYFGEKFSHCGVNNMTFAKTKDGWKIWSITDTRRLTTCD